MQDPKQDLDPDLNSKQYEKSDLEKIISDPQYCPKHRACLHSLPTFTTTVYVVPVPVVST
jgi:hypothetical protein